MSYANATAPDQHCACARAMPAGLHDYVSSGLSSQWAHAPRTLISRRPQEVVSANASLTSTKSALESTTTQLAQVRPCTVRRSCGQ